MHVNSQKDELFKTTPKKIETQVDNSASGKSTDVLINMLIFKFQNHDIDTSVGN